MHDFLQVFTEDFGPAISREEIPKSFFSENAGKLPESFLDFLKEEGWAGYANGLVWTLNPEKYKVVAEQWFSGFTSLEKSRYHIFARTAFGKFYAFKEDTGHVITITSYYGHIVADSDIAEPKSPKAREDKIPFFLGASEKHDFDCSGEEGYLFSAALQKLGPLSSNEVYGFVPALMAGGTATVENLQKLRMDVHLGILYQFAERKLYLVPKL